MHTFDEQAEAIAQANIQYALERVRMEPPPLDGPVDATTLRERTGPTITAEGIGGESAPKIFKEVLHPLVFRVTTQDICLLSQLRLPKLPFYSTWWLEHQVFAPIHG